MSARLASGLVPLVRVAFERDAGHRGRRLIAAAWAGVRDRRRPHTLRALEVGLGGRVRWRAVPALRAPAPLAATVRPLAIATCDLDRPLALGGVLPLRFGHECVGEVLAVGEQVTSVRAGDRVVVPFQISCGICKSCQAGHTANCLAVPPMSMYGFGLAGGHWGGAMADELAVPYADAMLVPLPAGLDPVHAASVADNVSDAWRHVGPFLPGLLVDDPDARVVIVAAMRRHLFTASVPLYAGMIARALGARHIVLADARDEVREQAAALGLDAVTPTQARKLNPAPLVIDASASAAGLKLHVGRTHARAVIPHVLELMATGALKPQNVTTLVAPLDEAPAALAEHFRGASTKTILTAY